jgi:hypothetical protein
MKSGREKSSDRRHERTGGSCGWTLVVRRCDFSLSLSRDFDRNEGCIWLMSKGGNSGMKHFFLSPCLPLCCLFPHHLSTFPPSPPLPLGSHHHHHQHQPFTSSTNLSRPSPAISQPSLHTPPHTTRDPRLQTRRLPPRHRPQCSAVQCSAVQDILVRQRP